MNMLGSIKLVFCAWLSPYLYLRDPHASLGDCEDRSHSRPLRKKWSEALPCPLLRGSPLVRTTPLQYMERTKRLGALHIKINTLAFVMDHILCVHVHMYTANLLLCFGLPCVVFLISWCLMYKADLHKHKLHCDTLTRYLCMYAR